MQMERLVLIFLVICTFTEQILLKLQRHFIQIVLYIKLDGK